MKVVQLGGRLLGLAKLSRNKNHSSIGKAIAPMQSWSCLSIFKSMPKILRARALLVLPAIVLCTCELALAASGHLWTFRPTWMTAGMHMSRHQLKWSDSGLLLILGICLMLSTIAIPRLLRRRRRYSSVPLDTIEPLEETSTPEREAIRATFSRLGVPKERYDETMMVQ